MRLRRLLLLLAAVSLVFPRPVGAQPARFSLHGRVLDPMRGSIAGARITGVPDGHIAGQAAVSDQNGDFTLVLDAGRYTITVIADGFLAASQAIQAPQTGSESREFVLQLAGVQDTVTVTAQAPGYEAPAISSGTKTLTLLRDVPQSVTVVTQALIRDQLMTSISDVVRYVPGITAHQGENNRDQVIIRGNNSSADFFLNGVRDDVQYYRDLYNLDRVEALKGPNAMIFGRGGGGGVINRVTKEASFAPLHEVALQGGTNGNRRFTTDLDQPLTDKAAFRLNGMYESSESFRNAVNLERYGISPTLTVAPDARTKITRICLPGFRTADPNI